MHFSFTSIIAIMATLSASSSAFVIDTYSGSNCNTIVENNVNTWDNTCATWPKGFKSFRIRTWGGNHQHAYFFAPNNCGSLPDAIKSGYVDSTTNDFKLNTCYSFNGASANAIASYRG
ncbi:hypothetical protein BU25DRAFT_445186 [Macroventuria anomochaeta]|uniref:Uncharacterized protein n=1 Tax=Macroventuria anomochaeta TaxID=301207 RepID=A0ACB6SG04_9PLEO|nr:uncharacterized protein BU25DRAFT_445186 [Macroventuria anomochaeta]KAF2632032.1 hypothetical protein BU25DRAFT_445186 [Macroventuria anomochaeta]